MLKPCPFCGGPATIKKEEDPLSPSRDTLVVGCPECPVEFSAWTQLWGGTGDEEKEIRAGLIAKWNTRKWNTRPGLKELAESKGIDTSKIRDQSGIERGYHLGGN